MALCVPKVAILGNSFVRSPSGDLEQHFDDRAKSNFNLKDVKVHLFSVGGRTVHKIKQFDLANVPCFASDVVILEIGNGLTLLCGGRCKHVPHKYHKDKRT